MRICLQLFLLLALAGTAAAHTFRVETFTCPLCTNKWEQAMDQSGTQMGLRLDLKPLGPIAAPWSVPVCEKCFFVLFKGSDGKYSAAEVKDLKTFVASAAYAKLPKDAPSYQRLALLREHLKQPSEQIGVTWLQASWQAERNAALCRLCLKQCGLAYDAYLKSAKPEGNDYRTAALARGEVYRRLGEFAAAKTWFEKLQPQPAFAKEHYPGWIAQQLKLIAAKDTQPHQLEDPDSKR